MNPQCTCKSRLLGAVETEPPPVIRQDHFAQPSPGPALTAPEERKYGTHFLNDRIHSGESCEVLELKANHVCPTARGGEPWELILKELPCSLWQRYGRGRRGGGIG